ncbi:glycosyltransferase family 1 protein [Calocera viscosa TUFC12733]|uniref:Glycosyltransferase family 1 protein n=1 Tax=Calocera viscosa (strain TUFC12733) TaxID=1330018 RepID=A0A167GNM7_CALVF|nr:glycosyltransferase family 1 protein [Calocera viscosa TUFC12733]
MVRHVLLVSYFAWGHLRPECALAVTLVRKFEDVVLCAPSPPLPIRCSQLMCESAFVVDCDFTPRAVEEMARQCSPLEAPALLSRIRVLSAGRTHAGATPGLLARLMLADPRDLQTPSAPAAAAAERVVRLLIADKEVTDDLGEVFPPVGCLPRAMVGDLMMASVLVPVKRDHPDVWLLLWWVGTAGSFTRMYAPHERGGKSDGYVKECEETFADEGLRKGRSFGDIARDVSSSGLGCLHMLTARKTWAISRRVADNTVRLAGLPPFYQHEDAPQAFWFPTLFDALRKGGEVVHYADVFLLPTIEALEEVQVRDVVDWARPRRVLCCGPQLPREILRVGGAGGGAGEVNYNVGHPDGAVAAAAGMERAEEHMAAASAVEKAQANGVNGKVNGDGASPSVDPTIIFLDACLRAHGPHSALYISFGSVFFPQPSHIALLLQVLLALPKPMPFIFTLSRGTLPSQLEEEIVSSGRGLVVPWAPQQTLLAHEAMGWMVTHCGGGGTFESLSQGVPVIAWPFSGDQPQHALWISEVLQSGFELLQVRTGAGAAGPAYRGGGTEIVGTEEAVRGEMERVLGMCQGEEGARRRENAREAQEKIRLGVERGGSADRALDQLEWIF